MKLGSTAALSLALAVSATAGVSGFVPSLDHHAAIGRGTRNSADGAQPHLSVAAAPVDEAMDTASASSDDQQIPITDVNSVKSLSFRQLQRACVVRGLPAVGSTAALRSRLLDSAGLPDVSVPAAPKAANGSEDEVSQGIEKLKETVCKRCIIPCIGPYGGMPSRSNDCPWNNLGWWAARHLGRDSTDISSEHAMLQNVKL